MKIKLDGVALNIISAYAPQMGCMREEKEVLDEAVEKIPKYEKIILGADMNWYVG